MATVSWPAPRQRGLVPADFKLAAAFVNVLGFSLGFVEVMKSRGIANWQQLDKIADAHDLLAELRATTSFSLDQVAESIALLSAKTRGQTVESDSSMEQTSQEVLHSAGEFLRAFPLAEVCNLARSIGLEELAHRIQTGTEQLTAIYHRLHAPTSEQFRIAAVAYARGSIELDVAANLLGLCRSDLLVALESNGFSRTPEVVALDEAQRNAILGRIRKERLHRGGKPHLDSDFLARDVIATQRIEGVDARRWLPR